MEGRVRSRARERVVGAMRRRRRRVRSNPSGGSWLLIGGGVAVASVGLYFLTRPKTAAAAATSSASPQLQIVSAATSTPAPAAAAPSSLTPVATLTTGQVYTFYGAVPAGVASSQDLATALGASGWSGVSVPYFNGQGTLPTGMAATGFIATGTWNGPNGLSVQPGYVCVAGRCSQTTFVS